MWCACAEHPLARHCDILTAIETRISLLGMTFMKYVDLDLCCFIPGKVIDEIFTVLRTIQAERNPPRAYEVLQVVPATSQLRFLFITGTVTSVGFVLAAEWARKSAKNPSMLKN
jgi:hypothetical protein